MSSEIPACTPSLAGFPERSWVPRAHLNCGLFCCFPVHGALRCGCSTDVQPGNTSHRGCPAQWLPGSPGWLRLHRGFSHRPPLSPGNSFHMTAHQSRGPQNTFYICWLGQNLWFCLVSEVNQGASLLVVSVCLQVTGACALLTPSEVHVRKAWKHGLLVWSGGASVQMHVYTWVGWPSGFSSTLFFQEPSSKELLRLDVRAHAPAHAPTHAPTHAPMHAHAQIRVPDLQYWEVVRGCIIKRTLTTV